MDAAGTAGTVSDSFAPAHAGGSAVAFAAAGAACPAPAGILPAIETRGFEPAPWEMVEDAAHTAADALPDIVFLAAGDAVADFVIDMPVMAADIAVAVGGDADAPLDPVPAPWEPAAPVVIAEENGADLSDGGFEAAEAAEHWMDVFDADAGHDHAMPDHAAEFARVVDESGPADFAAPPDHGPADVAALLETFGHGAGAADDPMGADVFDYLAAWPAAPPEDADAGPG